jgi:ABC-type Fe3+ transport system substrate-binding protein
MSRRRRVSVVATALALVGLASSLIGIAAGQAPPPDEQARLQALYTAARAEGGELTVYMGGDAPGQWDALTNAFSQQFPAVTLHMVTDLSKYHDARIDNQLANHDLVADVAILQTTQDFDRWERQGQLLKYKPIGWDHIFDNAKDPNGYWTGVFYGAFSYLINNDLLTATPSDFTGTDLLGPQYTDKLILTYPNDDDAVLFGYQQIIDKYGWSYLRKLMAQHPTLIRGVPGSAAGVASGQDLASIAVGGDARPNGSQVFSGSERFTTWAQRGAIFKQAKHKAAAELFLSWLTSKTVQQNAIASWTWSVRSDGAPPASLQPLADYPNTNPDTFAKFMSDRAAVDRFRAQVELYLGPVTGPDPADPDNTLGPTPGAF